VTSQDKFAQWVAQNGGHMPGAKPAAVPATATAAAAQPATPQPATNQAATAQN
jgi:hypothetical protein